MYRHFRDWYRYTRIYRTAGYQVIISVLKRGTVSVSGTWGSFDTLTRLSTREDFVECYGRPARRFTSGCYCAGLEGRSGYFLAAFLSQAWHFMEIGLLTEVWTEDSWASYTGLALGNCIVIVRVSTSWVDLSGNSMTEMQGRLYIRHKAHIW